MQGLQSVGAELEGQTSQAINSLEPGGFYIEAGNHPSLVNRFLFDFTASGQIGAASY